MGRAMRDDERKWCEDILAKYEPYPEDSKEVTCFDYPCDPMRRLATTAKMFLDGKIPLKE